MKPVLFVIALIFLVGPAFTQEDSEVVDPRGAVNFVLLGSPALVGIGGELFVSDFGVGATFTFLPLGGGDTFILLLEPGAYARYYFGELESTFYLMGGLSYLTLASGSYDDAGFVDGGILRVNGGAGYNSLFGRENTTRFAFEIGPRFNSLVTNTEDEDDLNWIFIHFMLMFGRTL